MSVPIVFLIEVLAASFVLWLGLYIITRDLPWRHEDVRLWERPPLLVGTGLVLASIYFYGRAMEMVSVLAEEFIRWQQITQWGVPIGIFCCFWTVVLLTCSGRESPAWVQALYPTSAVVSALFALGIASGYTFNADGIRAGTTLFQPFYSSMHQPFGYLYSGFVFVGALASVGVLAHRLPKAAPGSVERHKILLGVAGGVLLLAGVATALTLKQMRHPTLPNQIGDYIATLGGVLLGYNVARFNALKHKQILASDFWHSFVGVAATICLCLLAYLALSVAFSYTVQSLTVVLVSIFIVLTHTPYTWGSVALDRLLLPRWAVGYREQLMLMRQQPLTAEDPSDSLDAAEHTFGAVLHTVRVHELEDLIRREVEQIFTYSNMNKVEVLSGSRLFELQIAQAALEGYAETRGVAPEELSDHQRAECLRNLLRSAIEEWTWSPEASSRRARIEQIILRNKYLEQNSRVEVERLLTEQFDVIITGGGYSRHLKNAREHLARVLHERELAAIRVNA